MISKDGEKYSEYAARSQALAQDIAGDMLSRHLDSQHDVDPTTGEIETMARWHRRLARLADDMGLNDVVA